MAALLSLAAQAQTTEIVTPTADVWVRTDAPTNSYGSGNTVEMKTVGNTKFYALLKFTLPGIGKDKQFSTATLRLTTRYKKGDSGVDLYDMAEDFDESATYASLETAIATVTASDPAATFKLNSYAQWAPTDKQVTEEYATVDKWQVEVDVTSLVQQHLGDGRVGFLLSKAMDQNNSSQIFSREATDQTNATLGFTFKAEDLVPQLTLTYSDATGAGISTLNTTTEQAPAYNLAGQRVGEDYRGIVVVGGKKFVRR